MLIQTETDTCFVALEAVMCNYDGEGMDAKTLLIQGEDEQSFINITIDKDDFMGVRLTIEAQSKGFSATDGGIYIVTDDITDFVTAFRTLEHKRSGEARLQSASPEVFDLNIRIINRKGHVLVSLRVTDSSYYEGVVTPCSLELCFGIDPTVLPSFLKQCQGLERDAHRLTSDAKDPFLG